MIGRRAAADLERLVDSSSAVALLGPRQVGKTTLARDLVDARGEQSVYLDLERPADRRRLDDADAYLRSQRGRLVVLDEVHRLPSLFEVLRGVIDDNRRAGHRAGQFLLLGSASLDLVQHSSESLAGRLSYLDLGGITVDEAADAGIGSGQLWLRGGFPHSLDAHDDGVSAQWRRDLVRSYLEREVPMFAPRIPSETLRRLWTMLAHTSGGLLNMTKLAESLAVSGPTVGRYVDLLADLGLVRRLPAWHVHTGRRLTRAPKVFVRDTGLLHSLLELDTMHALRGHPSVGSSFETLAVENLVAAAGPTMQAYHYRSARGDEADLVLVSGGRPAVIVEVKLSTSPTVSAGFHRSRRELEPKHAFVVHPDTGQGAYRTEDGVEVIGLTDLVRRLRNSPTG